MIVRLKGLTTNVIVEFMDDVEYRKQFGYDKMLPACYPCQVNNITVFRASNFTGFSDSLPVESYSDIGAGEIGNVFRGGYRGSRFIAWNFKNVFERNSYISPNEILATLVNAPNELVEVTAITDKEYTQIFHFAPDTSLEAGVIALESADSNNGTMWSRGQVDVLWYIFEQVPKVPFTLPQVLIDNSQYPLSVNIISQTIQNPTITIGGVVNGYWTSFRLVTDNQTLYYDNSVNKDEYITINSEELYIINEQGDNREDDIVVEDGTGKYPQLSGGINNFTLTVDDFTDFDQLHVYIPTDFHLQIKYEDLTSAVSGGIEC